MNTLTPYQPNFKKILSHSKNPDPLILSPEEYDLVLQKYGLNRGARLSDVGILKAMEAGVIKVIDPDRVFDLSEQIKCSSLDLRLGHEFWFYLPHKISCLKLGEHRSIIEDLDLLGYTYTLSGDVFVFHPNDLVLALTQEIVSLSNVVVGQFDGKSSAGRLGLSNHQTAGMIQPGFAGQIMMEISNTNRVDIAIPVLNPIGTLSFYLLDQPSSRPEKFVKNSQSNAYMQRSPFGFRKPEWDIFKRKARAAQSKARKNGIYSTGVLKPSFKS